MATVDARMVMALRRLTDLPVSMCRDALVEAGGDLAAVVQRLRKSPCCGLHASDAEVAAELSSHGVSIVAEERDPVVLPDHEVVAELTDSGLAIGDYFLIDELICSVNARGELMGLCIDDKDLASAALTYLRRMGAPEYPSLEAYNDRS